MKKIALFFVNGDCYLLPYSKNEYKKYKELFKKNKKKIIRIKDAEIRFDLNNILFMKIIEDNK